MIEEEIREINTISDKQGENLKSMKQVSEANHRDVTVIYDMMKDISRLSNNLQEILK